MSIVITVLNHKTKKVYMMGDKRVTTTHSYDISQPSVTHTDNFQKIGKITDNILIGFTGAVPVVNHFKTKFLNASIIHPTPIIKFIREYANKNPFPQSTVTIAGKYDKNQLFVVTMTSDGFNKAEVDVTIGNREIGDIIFKISSDYQSNEFHDYFIAAYNKHKNVKQAMSETVLYASTVSSTISQNWDLLETQ